MVKGMRKLILAALVALLVTGCSAFGPNLVSGTRTDYNVVLRQADDQQMLLNLVRLRYRDQPLFLELSALNTQFSVTSEVSAGTQFGDVDDLYSLGGKAILEETPTVSYAPLQGGDFVKRVLTPISLNTLFLLDTSGWSSERVIRLLVDEINGIENARGANGPTPALAPPYQDFNRMAYLLRQLDQQGLIIGASYQSKPVLGFESEAREIDEYLEFTRILGLNPDQLLFPVFEQTRGQSDDSIKLRFRSFVGVMYFLSQSVVVPEQDLEAGRVTVTLDSEGQPFDWQRVTEGLLTIKSSPTRPENASVAVNYRNSWFYIDDSDLESKSTFSLLGQVYQLQSGNAPSVVPTLTIPVGN